MSQCKHHWMMEERPVDGFTTGRCKLCGEVTRVKVWNAWDPMNFERHYRPTVEEAQQYAVERGEDLLHAVGITAGRRMR